VMCFQEFRGLPKDFKRSPSAFPAAGHQFHKSLFLREDKQITVPDNDTIQVSDKAVTNIDSEYSLNFGGSFNGCHI
jgi:hypothetical protein